MGKQNCPKSQSYQKYLLSVAVFTSLHEECSNQTGNHYTNISMYLKIRFAIIVQNVLVFKMKQFENYLETFSPKNIERNGAKDRR